jgi:hypothetical protein
MNKLDSKKFMTTEEEKQIWGILSKFTAEEIAFLIHYYEDVGGLIMGDSGLAEIIKDEQKIKGFSLGQFTDMLEIIYKAGTGGKKTNAEKIAQKLKKNHVNCVSDEEFFILTKAIYTGNPILLMYLSHVIIGEEI